MTVDCVAIGGPGSTSPGVYIGQGGQTLLWADTTHGVGITDVEFVCDDVVPYWGLVITARFQETAVFNSLTVKEI